MIATQDIDRIIGAEAVGPDNDKIGKVGQVYIDQDNEQPVWVSVKSGIFGTSETLVPLTGADWDQSALHLAFSKDRVKDAPRVDPDGELSPEEQQRLYEYYGMGAGGAQGGMVGGGLVDDPTASDRDRYTAAGGGERSIGLGRDTEDAGYGDAGVGAATMDAGRDTSGPNTDDAMTRSEERVQRRDAAGGGRPGAPAQVRRHRADDRDRAGVPRGGPDRARADHRRQPGRGPRRPEPVGGGARGRR